jgi:methyltransferase (TIGR00027 family)
VTKAPKFSDPTALAFLSEEARASLLRLRAGATEAHDQLQHHLVRMRSEVVVARTIAVDEAVRVAAAPQLVNLGAGLDGRAWRMSELSNAVVFEVDRPGAQAEKRLRAAPLTPTAKDIRFVSVDFAHDSLDAALARAGHEAETPTMWLWEGVVPYLTAVAVEATLAVIQGRSAPGSRLAVVYQSPSRAATVGTQSVTALSQTLWKNERLHSWWTPEQMQAQLDRVGFRVASDRDLADLAAEFGADLSSAGQLVRDGRVVVAARR